MSPPAPDDPQPKPAETALERGQSIDRFVVIGLVGRGGMGEVYAAYDPELDRKVAIKLLRAHGESSEGRTRLLREAQAIAKLSHPNVVVVYDVGTFGENVFIAMEFVDGRTLSGWMHAGKRSQREIMQVFLAAGRGLAAAHAAGLIHRDFKPDNVMVTNDGQVRVMDFGLARQAGETDAHPGAASALPAPADFDPDATANLGLAGSRAITPPGAQTSGKYLSVKLTLTGAMMGTPAYMAPEQFAMAPTDPRTDQFSFCVALYEMLYGQRPFEGTTFLALMTSVTTGTPGEAPAKASVPGWMRKVLLRGLATDPDGRHPSMNALLHALQTDPTVRPRRIALGVVALAALVAGGMTARRAIGAHQAMCTGGAERWAGVWERGEASPRKEAIRRAFAATGKSYADQAWKGASRILDEYAGKWIGAYTDACEATHVRGEQSAEVLDLRMGCLKERLTSATALSEIFAHADGTAVENAVSAAGSLPRIDRCADVAALRAVIKPPEDEALRRRVDGLRTESARLAALKDSGHCAEAERLAQKLVPDVRAAGYLPLVAETLNAAGFLADQCVALEVGLDRFRGAYSAGIASRHDEEAAKAAIVISGFLADRAEQPAMGRDWLTVATALLDRLGRPALLETWLLNSEAGVLAREGRQEDAIRVGRQALDAKVKLLGAESHDIGTGFNTVGNALASAGRHEEAIAAFDRARAIFTKALGAEHPMVAMALSNGGESRNALKRWVEARAGFQGALDIWRQSGSEAMFVAYGLTGVGLASLGEGRPADAIAPLEEALRIRSGRAAGPERLGEVRFALARALWMRPATRERARSLARAARDDYAQVKTGTATVAAIDAWLAAPT